MAGTCELILHFLLRKSRCGEGSHPPPAPPPRAALQLSTQLVGSAWPGTAAPCPLPGLAYCGSFVPERLFCTVIPPEVQQPVIPAACLVILVIFVRSFTVYNLQTFSIYMHFLFLSALSFCLYSYIFCHVTGNQIHPCVMYSCHSSLL